MQASRGFTLIELVIVVALIAIITAVAAPNYQSSIEAGHKTSATNNILGALQFARSEAVVRRKTVKVCAGADCTAGNDWKNGGVVMEGATLLRSIPAAPEVGFSGSDIIEFKPDGSTAASSISVTTGKTISINIVGHAKID